MGWMLICANLKGRMWNELVCLGNMENETDMLLCMSERMIT